jgi:hypothetical protein
MYFYVVLCIDCFVSFSVLFVCICVLNYCHRVGTQLQLNVYHIYQQRCLFRNVLLHVSAYWRNKDRQNVLFLICFNESILYILVFKLSPCCSNYKLSSGYSPASEY